MAVFSEQEDAKIVRLYQVERLGVVKIARQLHHDSVPISQVLRNHGIWIRGSRNFTDAEEAQIARIYEAGFSTKAIARAYGLNHHISICATLERQGIEQRSAPERNRLYKLNPHVFDKIDNELAAYHLGFLYADGCVSRRTLGLVLKASDRIQLERLRDFLESESPIKSILVNLGGSKNYPQCRIEFTDRHLAKRLRSIGILACRPKPRLVINAVQEPQINHFVRGYFDGDGCAVKTNPAISFCGQREFLEWMRDTLAIHAKTNPQLSVYKAKNASAYRLGIGGRIQALKVANYMYNNASIWLPRKREVITSWPEPKPHKRDEKGRYI